MSSRVGFWSIASEACTNCQLKGLVVMFSQVRVAHALFGRAKSKPHASPAGAASVLACETLPAPNTGDDPCLADGEGSTLARLLTQ